MIPPEKHFSEVQLQVESVRSRNAAWGRRTNICPDFPRTVLFSPHFFKLLFGIYFTTRPFMLCKHRPTKRLECCWNKTSRTRCEGEGKKLKGRKQKAKKKKKKQPAQQTAFKSLSSSLVPLFSHFCPALSVLFLSSSLSYKSPAPLASVQMMIWHCPGPLCCQLSKKKRLVKIL